MIKFQAESCGGSRPGTPLRPRQLDRVVPRGRAAEERSGMPKKPAEKSSNCKGAFGKTSGRSIFRNAPLRATSSALKRSSWTAIRKTLSAHTRGTGELVGFARWPENFTRRTAITVGRPTQAAGLASGTVVQRSVCFERILNKCLCSGHLTEESYERSSGGSSFPL